MGKYYIRPASPESFDYKAYYDENQAVEDGIYARGDGWEVNEDLRKDVVNSIYNFFDANENGDEDIITNARDCFNKKTGKLTLPEIREIIDLTEDYYNLSQDEEDETIAGILTILNGEEYAVGSENGYSQGDFVDYIYPKRLEKTANYMAQIFMAKGTEFMITTEKHDKIPDFYEEDIYYDFCTDDNWGTENVRKWAADSIGCKEDEVVVLNDDGEIEE